jgi:hypothetical protein
MPILLFNCSIIMYSYFQENQDETIPTTIIDPSNGINDQMTESTMTIKNDDNIVETEVEELEPEMANFDIENISILIPTLDFFAEVPPELFPPLLPHDGRNEEKDSELKLDHLLSNYYVITI